jgi:hypothetical protein
MTEKEQRSTASTLSNSLSSHATASQRTSTVGVLETVPDSVQGLRDFSVMDSSSFDDEPHSSQRLLLTSLLFRLLFGLIPFLKNVKRNNAANKTEYHNSDAILLGASFPLEEHVDETFAFKMFRFSIFFLCFIFWPAGIPRRKVEYKPLPKKPEKPSLLKLVFEAEQLQQQQQL